MTEKYPNKRKYVRYRTEPFPYALIDQEPEREVFQPGFSGLVIQEAHGGCGIVTSSNLVVKEADRVKVQIGDQPLMKAEVRWQKELDMGLIVIGVQFFWQ